MPWSLCKGFESLWWISETSAVQTCQLKEDQVHTDVEVKKHRFLTDYFLWYSWPSAINIMLFAVFALKILSLKATSLEPIL